MQRVIAGARGAACGDYCLRVRAEREMANNNNNASSSGLVSVRERDALIIIEALRQEEEIEQQLTHQ